MARQRSAASSTSSGGRSGSRRGVATTLHRSPPQRTAVLPNPVALLALPDQQCRPESLHDVYDFAQASTSNQNRGSRRALAGMQADDYADLPSKAKGKQARRRADDDEDGEDEDSDDSDAAPIGPKVFDSEDELNAGIEGSDEELDSDEAFGESDEEKFDGWTFGRGAKSIKRKSGDSDDEEDEEEDDGEDDGGMMDLSRMLDSASESSDSDDDQDDDASDNDNDQSSSKLAKHIESFAAGSKRTATADSEAGSDAEPTSKRSRRVLSERTEAIPRPNSPPPTPAPPCVSKTS